MYHICLSIVFIDVYIRIFVLLYITTVISRNYHFRLLFCRDFKKISFWKVVFFQMWSVNFPAFVLTSCRLVAQLCFTVFLTTFHYCQLFLVFSAIGHFFLFSVCEKYWLHSVGCCYVSLWLFCRFCWSGWNLLICVVVRLYNNPLRISAAFFAIAWNLKRLVLDIFSHPMRSQRYYRHSACSIFKFSEVQCCHLLKNLNRIMAFQLS